MQRTESALNGRNSARKFQRDLSDEGLYISGSNALFFYFTVSKAILTVESANKQRKEQFQSKTEC